MDSDCFLNLYSKNPLLFLKHVEHSLCDNEPTNHVNRRKCKTNKAANTICFKPSVSLLIKIIDCQHTSDNNDSTNGISNTHQRSM